MIGKLSGGLGIFRCFVGETVLATDVQENNQIVVAAWISDKAISATSFAVIGIAGAGYFGYKQAQQSKSIPVATKPKKKKRSLRRELEHWGACVDEVLEELQWTPQFELLEVGSG